MLLSGDPAGARRQSGKAFREWHMGGRTSSLSTSAFTHSAAATLSATQISDFGIGQPSSTQLALYRR
jgi:hypothetical protein